VKVIYENTASEHPYIRAVASALHDAPFSIHLHGDQVSLCAGVGKNADGTWDNPPVLINRVPISFDVILYLTPGDKWSDRDTDGRNYYTTIKRADRWYDDASRSALDTVRSIKEEVLLWLNHNPESRRLVLIGQRAQSVRATERAEAAVSKAEAELIRLRARAEECRTRQRLLHETPI